MKTLRHSARVLVSFLIFALLGIPGSAAQGDNGVTGIRLTAVPNAVTAEWDPPAAVSVMHYYLYYAKQSLLENNGRFDGKEPTLGKETSIALLDLGNRGFHDGDTIYVTVTAVDDHGNERVFFAEEKSTVVQIPGAPPPEHAAADDALVLEHAISLSLTTVTLHFSQPVMIPSENPSAHFTIVEEATGRPVGVVSSQEQGQDVILTTLPMTTRSRYIVNVAESVRGEDGAALDSEKHSAAFIARGEEAIPTEPTPPSPGSTSAETTEPEETVPEMPVQVEPTVTLPVPDTTPPEPPSGLTLRKTLQKNGSYTVHATWQESLNTARDLETYRLYESADRGAVFVGPTALAATVTSTTLTDVPPGTLTVKVSSVDRTGNESMGVSETIILPETGAALTLFMSFAGAAGWTMRKKRWMKK